MSSYGEEQAEGESSSSTFAEKKQLLFLKQSDKMLKRVVRMLDVGNPASVISEGASRMVSCIDNGLFSREDLEYIGSQQRVLEGMVSLFSLENSRVRRWVALRAFYNLAKSETNKMRLVSCPEAVEGLVNMFSRTLDSSTQLLSLETFSLLSESPEISIELACTPGMIHTLTEVANANLPREINDSVGYVLQLLHTVKQLHTSGRIRSRVLERHLSTFLDDSPTKFRRAANAFLAYATKYEKDEAALESHVETIAKLLDLHVSRMSV